MQLDDKKKEQIKAVLFDLDGTLLPIDTDRFVKEYMQLLTRRFSGNLDSEQFFKNLQNSTSVMIKNCDPLRTNRDVFIEDFMTRLGLEEHKVEALFSQFYNVDFPELVTCVEQGNDAVSALLAAFDKGFEVVIATKPVFPRQAITERLKWIGADNLNYSLITSYENMHSCKPSLDYYSEILSILGRKPEECVMIGNDVDDDLCAGKLGIKTVLVTDYLINRHGREIKADLEVPAEKLPELIQGGFLEL